MAREFLIGLVVSVLLSPVGAFASAPERSQPVSPGSRQQVATVWDTCPTFSWEIVAGARAYWILVYEMTPRNEPGEIVIRRIFSGGVSSWTPAVSQGLAAGKSYVWTVGTVAPGGNTLWSEAALFRVDSGPDRAELEEAVEVIQRYLAAEDGSAGSPAGSPARSSAGAGASPPGGDRATPELPVSAAPPPNTVVSVDGNVNAESFSGSGALLTELDPASLSAGTAAIDITGTATPTGPAGGDLGGEYPNPKILDEIARDEEVGKLIEDHAALPNVHHVKTVDTVLTESQVEAFVTNGPLSGATFTNLNASNLTTGTVAEQRIASEIARDAEVAAQIASALAAERACPGSGASPNRYTDCGNGTVRDNNTGLIWLKDASCAALAGTDAQGRGNAATAQSAAAALSHGTCGLTDGSSAGDWRQPTTGELCSAWTGLGLYPCPAGAASTSLIDSSLPGAPYVANAAGTGLWAEGDAFVGVQSADYWSATPWGVGWIWGVSLVSGYVNIFEATRLCYIWPVRSGQ